MVEMKLLSSLEKVFPASDVVEAPLVLQALQGETVSFQLALRLKENQQIKVLPRVMGPIAAHVRLRQVVGVPVRMAHYPDGDADTLCGGATGLYPDLLQEIRPQGLRLTTAWTTIWVDVSTDALSAGTYSVTVQIQDGKGATLSERTILVEVLAAVLPSQKLLLTRWFHCDGLARLYRTEAFSEKHWEVIENQLRTAVKHGMNMLLTPVHTPPLDTAVGHERMTIQLVDVFREGGVYRFNMEKLCRWIRMAKGCGITHFEVAHLYTQWGAKHAPKIMATVDGEYRRIFGWETDAVCDEYRGFLAAYIPAIRQVFAQEGVAESNVRWHISDEPSGAQLDSYLAAKRQVEDLLQGCIIMDALSNFEYYQQGIVQCPVVATDHAEPFLQAQVPDMWVYYCCVQYKKVANMFIAMPSSRSRVLGFQLFRNRAAGFLHWGYNFYNCMGSWYGVNPYLDTDADQGVPAGDPFQVYPGEDGLPEESIRLMVFSEAMADLRACELLAEKKGRAWVNALLDEAADGQMTYQTVLTAEELLALRSRINREIMA